MERLQELDHLKSPEANKELCTLNHINLYHTKTLLFEIETHFVQLLQTGDTSVSVDRAQTGTKWQRAPYASGKKQFSIITAISCSKELDSKDIITRC